MEHPGREIAPGDVRSGQLAAHACGQTTGPAPDVEDAAVGEVAKRGEDRVVRWAVEGTLDQREVVDERPEIEETALWSTAHAL